MAKRINSRQKGARIERSAAAWLNSLGIKCERAARSGVHEGEDIIVRMDRPISIEVKGDQSVDIGTKALEYALVQATERCSQFCGAFVLWKHNRGRWRMTFNNFRLEPEHTKNYTVTIGQDDAAKLLRAYFGIEEGPR